MIETAAPETSWRTGPARLRRWRAAAIAGASALASRSQSWARRSPRATEAILVIVTLASVQVGVFWGFYTGRSAPGGDFLGPYSNEAFAWWRSGGIMSPPEWMPYLWGGYPAAASIQNSSYYLPAGALSLFGLGIRASAVLLALHVAFGGLGAYLLGRSLGFGRYPALVGLLGYTFSNGFFANAMYVDIMRGHAFAPWVLLCLSPRWPWRRWWAVAAAVLLWWQCFVSVYPGMLVAFAYGGAIWLLGWWLRGGAPLRRLAPLALSVIVGGLLAMPKYLPLLGLGTVRTGAEDLSVLSWSILGTFVLPPYPSLPGTYSLNVYFVPAAILVLAALARLRSRPVVVAALTMAGTVLLTLPGAPWHSLVRELPGMSGSRFTLNDFRPLIVLPLVVAAMSGAQAIAVGSVTRKALGWRLAAVGTLPVIAGVALIGGSFRQSQWPAVAATLLLTVVVIAAGAIALHAVAHRRRWLVDGLAISVVALTAASGVAFAQSVREYWSIDSVSAQRALWGATSEEMIVTYHAASGERRPGRSALDRSTLDVDPGQQIIDKKYNSAYYTGLDAIGGYLNVQNSASYVETRIAAIDPAQAISYDAFWTAPGMLIATDGGAIPDAEASRACVDSGQCRGMVVRPVSYSPGRLLYEVSAEGDVRVVANEAFYEGWVVTAADEHGRVLPLRADLGPAGSVSFTLPAGDWRVNLVYHAPHLRLGRALALLGLVLLAGHAALDTRRRIRTR